MINLLVYFIFYEAIEQVGLYFSRLFFPSFMTTLDIYELSREYVSQYPSIVHAIIASCHAIYCIHYDQPFVANSSLAYFLYDFISICVQPGESFDPMLIHHLIAVWLIHYMKGFPENDPINKAAPYLLLSEFSTIFLCLSILFRGPVKLEERFIKRYNTSKSLFLSKVSFIFFSIYFFLFRIFLMPYTFFIIYGYESILNQSFVFNFILLFLYVMQCYWMKRIVLILGRNKWKQN